LELKKITFDLLQRRLLENINWRINNGEYTERGLARLLGISQPQMHNVRKGIRRLSVELADRMLAQLNILLPDLMEETELSAYLREVDAAGPGLERTRKPAGRMEPARANWRKSAG
jgi:transcriptional regulator with XRE-family HTH domain